MNRCGWAVAVLLALAALPLQASKLYKWTDEQGRTQYSQTPPPDKSIDYRSSDLRSEVNEELRPYCEALTGFASEVFWALQRGVPAASVISSSRSIESTELRQEVNRGQLQEVANAVVRLPHDPKMDVGTVGKLISDSCLRGSYGKFGIAGKSNAAAGGRSGTGWFVDSGLIVTSLHVVQGRSEFSVVTAEGNTLTAQLVNQDTDRDLALLAVDGAADIPALPMASEEARIGAAVFTVGFPHPDVMGVKPKLTDGVISARSGVQDDPDMYQISVPVQAGNSGGPLLDERGYVVGVVASKLSAGAMYRERRDVTENVNYAVKSGFLHGMVPSPRAEAFAGGAREDLIEHVQASIVRVLAK